MHKKGVLIEEESQENSWEEELDKHSVQPTRRRFAIFKIGFIFLHNEPRLQGQNAGDANVVTIIAG